MTKSKNDDSIEEVKSGIDFNDSIISPDKKGSGHDLCTNHNTFDKGIINSKSKSKPKLEHKLPSKSKLKNDIEE